MVAHRGNQSLESSHNAPDLRRPLAQATSGGSRSGGVGRRRNGARTTDRRQQRGMFGEMRLNKDNSTHLCIILFDCPAQRDALSLWLSNTHPGAAPPQRSRWLDDANFLFFCLVQLLQIQLQLQLNHQDAPLDYPSCQSGNPFAQRNGSNLLASMHPSSTASPQERVKS